MLSLTLRSLPRALRLRALIPFCLAPLYLGLLLSFGLPTSLAALSCGDTLSGVVTLQQNLHCPGPGVALTLEAEAVLVLNGFTLSGVAAPHDPRFASTGLHIQGDGAIVLGPGAISGFNYGVIAVGVNDIRVGSVDFSNHQDGSIVWRSVSRSAIDGSTFQDDQLHSIAILDMTGQDASELNFLFANSFDRVHYAIFLCGPSVAHNDIEQNLITEAQWAQVVCSGSHDNRFSENQVVDSVIATLVYSAQENDFLDETYSSNRTGWQLSGGPPSYPGWPPVNSYDIKPSGNFLDSSTLQDNEQGVLLGTSSLAEANGNIVLGSVIDGSFIGIALGSNSSDNGVYANTVCGSQVSIEDLGVGNTVAFNTVC
ncbi:MAG: NosD domain-containing protein [Acidobacteriota bacterium]